MSVHQNNSAQELGAFAVSALSALEYGLAPIPCGGEDGKRPLIRGWQKRSYVPKRSTVLKLENRFPAANLGIACSSSGLVIVDVDEPNIVEDALSRFGDTPLVIDTPAGGSHLYYRSHDAGCLSKNLRHSEGLSIDIKGDGGFVVAPPSTNPKLGARYEFRRGSWSDLSHLPRFDATSIVHVRDEFHYSPRTSPDKKIVKGQRNDFLFRELLRHACCCGCLDQLILQAQKINDEILEPPLAETEVVKTAQSAWRYQCEGRNWIGRSPRIQFTMDELMAFAGHTKGGDALILWGLLTSLHGHRNEPIAIDREAMAAAQLLPSWKAGRYRTARDALSDLSLLELVNQGGMTGTGRTSPNLYRLITSVAASRHNTTRTPRFGSKQSGKKNNEKKTN